MPQENPQQETSSRPQTASLSGCETLERQRFAAERARLMLGCYRKGDASDPDTYVLAIAAVLAMFEPEIIRYATDPRTGITTQEKFRAFMPNSGEVKAFCDAERDRAERLRRHSEMPRPNFARLPPPPPAPGARANVFVSGDSPRYEEMMERTKTGDPLDWKIEMSRRGVWVALTWLDREVRRGRSGDIAYTAEQLAGIADAPTGADFWLGVRRPVDQGGTDG